MNRFLASSCAFVACLATAPATQAYEIDTHWILTLAVYQKSDIFGLSLRKQLGIDEFLDDRLFKLTPTSTWFGTGRKECDEKAFLSLREVLACGAVLEDIPGDRSLHHFYDPAHQGQGLTAGVLHGWPSPDWALQDDPNARDDRQLYSYRHARQYFYDALTSEGPANAVGGRNQAWALTFQTLGMIVHHLQDQAQPQHTRNDLHNDWLGEIDLGPFHPSRYEKYTAGLTGVSGAVQSVIDRAFGDIRPVFPEHRSRFKKPRDLFVGTFGIGVFTNSSFVSEGTNFRNESGAVKPHAEFPLPLPEFVEEQSIAEAFAPDAVPTGIALLCSSPLNLPCNMKFHGNWVRDPLISASVENRRASTESIFDEDLKGPAVTQRMFALNQLNFRDAHVHLVPRAVAYSAGLVNYFFRGRMEIAKPADGVYALVDHKTQKCKDTCGFDKVKLRVRNTTPGEDMTGHVRAVLKFRRNTCYREDLSGDAGGPNFLGFSCRSDQEEAVVSPLQPFTGASGGPLQELTFVFDSVLPINATDVLLQVVFTGRLGAEDDAVAVATRNISEPVHVAVSNDTDMLWDPYASTYRPNGPAEPLLDIQVGFLKPPLAFKPLASLSSLAPAGHAQLAFLTDMGEQGELHEEYVELRGWSRRYTLVLPRGDQPVPEFVLVPGTAIYYRSGPVALRRGVYRWYHYSFHYPEGSLDDLCVPAEVCRQETMPPLTPGSASEFIIDSSYKK
ncbi:MAG: hypothetical protein IT518_10745 [Burkholderiales bacterium]|nr:hypothetical protein [Burkholderiales bacterium]